MRRFIIVLGSLFLCLSSSALAAERPIVLQPNASAYSPTELATLLPAMGRLDALLSAPDLSSRQFFGPGGWQSRGFALYTGGRISELAQYSVKVVSAGGWPDGEHTWLLVGIPLGTRTAWVPVEPSPLEEHAQIVLGTIAASTDATGAARSFDARYLAFTAAEDLPPDVPPVAKIRGPVALATAQEMVRLLAIESYDPDGRIVLYRWDFGDGESRTTASPSIDYASTAALAPFVATLTVVDDKGRSGKATISLPVTSGVGTPSTPPACPVCGH